jgi:hypothetical protein
MLAVVVSAAGAASPTPARARDAAEAEMIGFHQLCQKGDRCAPHSFRHSDRPQRTTPRRLTQVACRLVVGTIILLESRGRLRVAFFFTQRMTMSLEKR